MSEPSALLAYVQPVTIGRAPEGPILCATAEFQTLLEFGDGGYELGDHFIPGPEWGGLLIFEGWLEFTDSDDGEPDQWRGEWRRLTHWEMVRVRCGQSPWTEPAERAELQKEGSDESMDVKP